MKPDLPPNVDPFDPETITAMPRCLCCGERFRPRRSRHMCDRDYRAVSSLVRMSEDERQAVRDGLDAAEAQWRIATEESYLPFLGHTTRLERPAHKSPMALSGHEQRPRMVKRA